MTLILVLDPQEYCSGVNCLMPRTVSHSIDKATGKVHVYPEGTLLEATNAVYCHNRRQWIL